MSPNKTVAIIGAGPVGLAAAAHALERGLTPVVLEAGPRSGHAVRQWSHVRMFSPWKYNVDSTAARLLRSAGWIMPDADRCPTGSEFVAHYLEPLATRTPLAGHIRTGHKVAAVARAGFDKVKSAGRDKAAFELHFDGQPPITAAAVIDASGTWFTPNPAGANGLPVPGEARCGGRIVYGTPDLLGAARVRYAGKTVAVLGSGHSAIGSLIDLAELARSVPATRIIWITRGGVPDKAFGSSNDQLAERGALGGKVAALLAQGRIPSRSWTCISPA